MEQWLLEPWKERIQNGWGKIDKKYKVTSSGIVSHNRVTIVDNVLYILK